MLRRIETVYHPTMLWRLEMLRLPWMLRQLVTMYGLLVCLEKTFLSRVLVLDLPTADIVEDFVDDGFILEAVVNEEPLDDAQQLQVDFQFAIDFLCTAIIYSKASFKKFRTALRRTGLSPLTTMDEIVTYNLARKRYWLRWHDYEHDQHTKHKALQIEAQQKLMEAQTQHELGLLDVKIERKSHHLSIHCS
ncbi:hypothetical protein MLD38_018893 [Melastoma candidum]|uniref:Uncharacterized protein n=1 Tax=Melastoma candidum TaxID=119954 RepID=A0ACB9QZ92_9MYRT|nr:hypothetical protein MLD38_018893 [Melastoma candidum]